MNPLAEMAGSLSTALPFSLDLLLRLTIVLSVVQLLVVAMKRSSAASRHFVVTLGLVAAVLLPVLMVSLPDARFAILPGGASEAFAQASSADTARGSWKAGNDAEATKADDFQDIARVISSAGLANQRALSVATGVLWLGDNWQVLLLAAVTLIPILFLSRILMGMVAVCVVARRAEPAGESWMTRELVQAARRLSVRRPIRMLLSDRINVPLVWGFLRPVLILPSSARNWSRDRFRVVILHEVAHVRRFDVLSLMTGRLATALYWFHPLSWMLERAGRRDCERACDDLVLRTGARASEYADHLLGIAAGEDLAESYASVTLAMARPSELEGRLLSILRADGERAPVSGRTASIAAALTAVMLLPIATVRLTAKPAGLEPARQASGSFATAPAPGVATSATADHKLQQNGEAQLVGDRKSEKKQYASEGERWFATGYDLLRQERLDDAIAAFGKAIDHGYRVDVSMYNVGCGHALKGDAGNAVRWITDAFDNGFDKVALVENDPDLDPIRSDPRFRSLLRDLRARFAAPEREDRLDATLRRSAKMKASGSRNAEDWASLGLDLLRLRQLDDAVFALEESIRLAPEYASMTWYNLACALALKGDSARSLDALEKAVLDGFDGGSKLVNDPDLTSIREDARFARIRELGDELSLWGSIKKQKSPEMPLDQQAAFREQLPRFESLVEKYPDLGRAWFNLGYASIQTNELVRAREAFTRALDLGFKRATSTYNLACVEALAGNREEAFRRLFEAEKAGAMMLKLGEDTDLESLHGDPRFDEMLERARLREKDLDAKKKQIKEMELKKKQMGVI